jgi:exodeoxyribonuclease V alpha subunit
MNRWPDTYHMVELTEHQRERMKSALAGTVGILTGCPGAGKTFCLAVLMRHLLAEVSPDDIIVCCPTGKAAVRATESMARAKLKVQATTVHRALGVRVSVDGFGFQHNADNPLACKYCIVDEASMLGTAMFHSLLEAIPDGCCLLLVGDHHQLPSVEPGAVLRDMIEAGVPHGDLEQIHRNSGKIVECCSSIRQGGPFVASQLPSYFGGPTQNLRHVKCRSNDDAFAQIQTLYASMSSSTLDCTWDVQLITPLNEGTPVARREINKHLQQALNPYGAALNSNYKFGDKVMCLKNKFYTNASGEEEFVCNGQIGVLSESLDKNTVLIVLRHAGWKNNEIAVQVPVSDLHDAWDLSYAISIHKSQGSSWPVVIMVMDQSGRGRFMANRQLIYTGLSRAEHYCIVIGGMESISEACKKDSMGHRVTGLARFIQEEANDTRKSRAQSGV